MDFEKKDGARGRITNIKFSVRFSPPFNMDSLNNVDPYMFDLAGSGRIIVRIQNYTFCIMGRLKDFLNVTGLKNLCEVDIALDLFKLTFSNSHISYAEEKIDSISYVDRLNRKLFSNIISDSKWHFSSVFKIKKYEHIISRVNISPQCPIGLSRGMSGNVFASGSITIFGGKSCDDIYAFLNLITSTENKLKT
jgi:hypothetical protein